MSDHVTATEYKTLSDGFDWLNRELFGDTLAPSLITLNNRNRRSRGFYVHERFGARRGDGRVSEIALNPDTFHDRTDLQILSTLAHEMAHAWQAQHGQPGRGGYHNREWAARMESIGLMPSHNGRPGGRRTGSQMTHYIIPDGPFERSARDFLKLYTLHWQASGKRREEAKKKRESKTKFTCPLCGQAAWAKLSAHLLCGDCNGEPLMAEDGSTWTSWRGGRARSGPWSAPPERTPKSHRIPNLDEIARMEERLRELRSLMQRTHPDRGGNAEEFQKVRAEYEALRKEYLHRTTQEAAA